MKILLLTLIGAVANSGDIKVHAKTGFPIELTDDERASVFAAPSDLLESPSAPLTEAISKGGAQAHIVDERGGVNVKFPLFLLLEYPDITAGELRTVEPRVQCQGTLYPVSWIECEETSDLFLDLPDIGRIKLDDSTIATETVLQLLATLDATDLQSPAGASIDIGAVKAIRPLGDDGAFVVRMKPLQSERCIVYLDRISGRTSPFEVVDLSCQISTGGERPDQNPR